MSKPAKPNQGRARLKRASYFYTTLDRRQHDPWAITAPMDPHCLHSRFDGVSYYHDHDQDELQRLITRGMEVD